LQTNYLLLVYKKLFLFMLIAYKKIILKSSLAMKNKCHKKTQAYIQKTLFEIKNFILILFLFIRFLYDISL